MPPELLLQLETGAAGIADKGSLRGVSHAMPRQSAALLKRLAAVLACVRLVARVNSAMVNQVAVLGKSFPTNLWILKMMSINYSS